MTTRAFVGAELCRNAEWLDIAINFTINRAIAVQAIQAWPWILQPVVHWFLPTCKAVRRQIQRARTILMPVLERERQTMHRKDSSSDRIFSTLTFIDQYAQGSRYDATMAQLRLTAVSVLTTSDMVEKVLARICEHPELIQPLREEVVSVFESSGLHHKSLLKLTLMESVMKESQRLEPATLSALFLFFSFRFFLSSPIPSLALSFFLADYFDFQSPCSAPLRRQSHCKMVQLSLRVPVLPLQTTFV
jgi:hypothetical protein